MIGQSESWNTNDPELEQAAIQFCGTTLGELLRAYERFRRVQLSKDVLL
jgi:hypothetical protein